MNEPSSAALARPLAVATRLGFDTAKPHWRVHFWRFVRRHRVPYVRLSTRRLRFHPEVIDAFIRSREIGSLKNARPFGSA